METKQCYLVCLTSKHLLAHIEEVLKWYYISNLKNDNITVNFNCTSYDDIHKPDEEAPCETNYLQNEDQDPGPVMLEVSSSDTEDNEIVANVIQDEPDTPVSATVTPTKNLTFLTLEPVYVV